MSNNVPTPVKRPFLTDAQYDQLKFLAQIVLPALGTLYFALAGIWGLPEAEKVVGTIVAVDTFLGVLLGISSRRFNQQEPDWDGNLEVVAHDTSLIHQLEITTPPEELAKKAAIILKVTPKHLKPYEGEFPEDKLR